MAAQHIQYFFKPPTSPSFTSRSQVILLFRIIDQISPIKDIFPNTNRASQNPCRNSARGVPQLISTRTQPSITRESCQFQRESVYVKQPSIHQGDQIAKAIAQLNQIKSKCDKSLESQIDTVISLLRAQVFDKENCNPNTELRQQVLTLQSSNEKLQNQILEMNKERKSQNNYEQVIRNLESQSQYIISQRDTLKQENENLQVKLLAKEQQYYTLQQELQQKNQQRNSSQTYEMILQQQQQKIIELEGLIASLRSLNNQEIKISEYQDLKWRFEQSIIAYQRKDKDWQQKIEEIRKLKQQVDQLNKKNQTLEIKLLEIVEQEVQQRLNR